MQETPFRTRFLQPSSWPIALKLLFAFFITGLLPLLFTAYYGANLALNNARANELRLLEQVAIATAARTGALLGATPRFDATSAEILAAQFAIVVADFSDRAHMLPVLIDRQNNLQLPSKLPTSAMGSGIDMATIGALRHATNSGALTYQNTQTHATELFAYAAMGSGELTVGVVEQGENWNLQLRQALRNGITKVLLVAAAAGLFAFLYFGREIILPIRALTETAKAVRQGQFTKVNVEAVQHDEIGEFANTFNSMVQSIQERERERDIFGRMVSHTVREQLLAGQIKLGGENRHVAVLISDIRDFTTLCEGMAPEDIVELLNAYLTEMTAAISVCGGYVNNFLGDAIIVLFGVPESHLDPSGAAVLAAFEMRERLGQFNIRQERAGKAIIRSGTAVATGTVIAGQMGSIERFQYTVIGDAVNVAARLETLTKEYVDNPILISEATKDDMKAPGNLQFVPMGQQALKGRTQPVKVFAVYKPPTNTVSVNHTD